MRDIRLNDIDAPCLQVRPDVLAGEEAFAEGDGNGGAGVEGGEFGDEGGEEGFFDEEGGVRLEEGGELFGHGAVDAAVEVEAGVEA